VRASSTVLEEPEFFLSCMKAAYSSSVTFAEPAYDEVTVQHSTAQHSTAQHSTAQHSTAQHSTAHDSTAAGQIKALVKNKAAQDGTPNVVSKLAQSSSSTDTTHVDLDCWLQYILGKLAVTAVYCQTTFRPTTVLRC
jgi:hypothetical protein